MIASKPIRLLSLAIVALVAIVGVRTVSAGFSVDGLGAGPEGAASKARGERTLGVVAFVLDGDTIQVDLSDGREVRVRFLGISAPEIPHPGKPGECYGKTATRRLEHLLPVGTQVTLVTDPTQDKVDRYGRWLRYVQAAGRDVGATQIRAGAALARDSSTPVARHAMYAQIERHARADNRGLWSSCRDTSD